VPASAAGITRFPRPRGAVANPIVRLAPGGHQPRHHRASGRRGVGRVVRDCPPLVPLGCVASPDPAERPSARSRNGPAHLCPASPACPVARVAGRLRVAAGAIEVEEPVGTEAHLTVGAEMVPCGAPGRVGYHSAAALALLLAVVVRHAKQSSRRKHLASLCVSQPKRPSPGPSRRCVQGLHLSPQGRRTRGTHSDALGLPHPLLLLGAHLV
jgi:hypothetical protein